MSGRVILVGGSGFLGQSLATSLRDKGSEVVILGRGPSSAASWARHAQWDGQTIGEWARLLESAQAVVNLAGRSVNCRHTPQNRQEIIDSRVNSVRVLGKAIAQC